MIKQKNRAFTLVELIVVITILAILWTIAFISFQWYSKDARDSTRISDMSSLKSTIELFELDAWKYPETTSWTLISYSWSEAWNQWKFWEITFKNVDRLNKIPLDPLTNLEYIYSVTNSRNEYQVAWIMEWEEYVFNNILLEKSIAAEEKTALLKIDWNYNWKILKVRKGKKTFVLAVPSIITSTWWTLEYIIENKWLAYNWFKNLPFNYGWWYKSKWENNLNLVNTWSYLLFEWDLKDFEENTTKQVEFIQALKEAYLDTNISWKDWIKEVVNLEWWEEFLAQTIINKNVNSNVKVKTIIEKSPSFCIDSETPSPESWFTFDEETRTISYIDWLEWVDLIIPCEYNWIPVENIAWVLQEDKSTINSYFNRVVIPDSVKTIWDYAFSERQITSLDLWEWLINIWYSSFSNTYITSLLIPDSVKIIWDEAFCWAYYLESVNLWGWLENIWDESFAYTSLTGSLLLPDSLKIIWAAAFEGNNISWNLIIPNNVTSLWAYSFNGNNITSLIIWTGISRIADWSFWYNELINLIIPENITHIWSLAFSFNRLTDIEIPSNVTEVLSWAFSYNFITSSNITVKCSLPTFWLNVFRKNWPSRITDILNPTTCTP